MQANCVPQDDTIETRLMKRTAAALSPQTLAAIVGHGAENYDTNMLAEADKVARRFLRAKGGVFISTSNTGKQDHYGAFEAIAMACDSGVEKGDDLLDQFAPVAEQDAGTVACDRYTPVLTAAYYFGICIGLRLASGGR